MSEPTVTIPARLAILLAQAAREYGSLLENLNDPAKNMLDKLSAETIDLLVEQCSDSEAQIAMVAAQLTHANR